MKNPLEELLKCEVTGDMPYPKTNNDKFSDKRTDKKELTFGKWTVSPDGCMDYDNDRYYIDSEDLKDDDWILHLFSKGWIDWNEFIPAYFQALKNAGFKNITIKVQY